MELNTLQKIILWIVPLIFAITVHEVAHGWVANKCGDPTAKNAGRLTLNPLKHIDPFGTIIIPGILLFIGGFVFGYAKPVPVDWRNLRHGRRDIILVALAGPAANLIMAMLWALIYKLGGLFMQAGDSYAGFLFAYTAQVGIMINIVLLVLNLIPIPPLDGSRVVACLLKGKALYYYARIEPYGFFILLGLMFLGALSWFMLPFINVFLTLIKSIFGLSM